MGISLGKLNYCMSELIKKGFVKTKRFSSSKNKLGYAYLITPHGLEEKVNLTCRFLKRKLHEYEEIKKQLRELAYEVEQNGSTEHLSN